MSQTHEGADRRSAPSTPRWVKVFGIIFIVLVLLVVVLNLTGHSPMGSHMNMPATQQGVQQP